MNRLLCWRSGDRGERLAARFWFTAERRSLRASPRSITCWMADRTAGDRQIPGGPHHQQRDHLLGTVVDHLDGVEQFRHRQHVHHRRPFGEADDFVEAGRQDGAQRLRQNYAHRATPGRQT